MKVKLIKVTRCNAYYGDYDTCDSALAQGISNWDEVTQDEYSKLITWVNKKNQELLRTGRSSQTQNAYVLALQDDIDREEIITDLSRWIKEEEIRDIQYKQRAEDEKKRKEAEKLVRKQKQLEKLKKELECK